MKRVDRMWSLAAIYGILIGLPLSQAACKGRDTTGKSSDTTGKSGDTTATTDIIPTDRLTTWNPGLNAVGGIPGRTTIYTTLPPSGRDDTADTHDARDHC